MMFEPWMLAAMEEEGYMDTKDGQINRLAKYLSKSSSTTIGKDEFNEACKACKVNASSFTQRDFEKLERKLNC